jgi:hypothetical protein
LSDNEIESIWLTIRQPIMPRVLSNITVCVIYHPPSRKSEVTPKPSK